MSDPAPVLATFARPTAERRTRLAVLADLHLSTDEHGTWRASHQTERRLAATVESLNREDLDGVFFNGDLVQSGTRDQFDTFDRIADRLDPPLFAVPGNHDLFDFGETGAEKIGLSEFENRYASAGFPYHERVGGVDLIGLNSNPSTYGSLAPTYEGRLDASTLSWLPDVLDEADCPIVAVHHTLGPVRELYRRGRQRLPVELGGSPEFTNGDALVDLLVRHGAPLVLTGHLHVPAVRSAGSLREFSLPPLGPFPCGYTVLDIDEHGTTASFRSIGDLDTRLDALALGLEQDRVLMAAAQLTDVPLFEEEAGCRTGRERR